MYRILVSGVECPMSFRRRAKGIPACAACTRRCGGNRAPVHRAASRPAIGEPYVSPDQTPARWGPGGDPSPSRSPVTGSGVKNGRHSRGTGRGFCPRLAFELDPTGVRTFKASGPDHHLAVEHARCERHPDMAFVGLVIETQVEGAHDRLSCDFTITDGTPTQGGARPLVRLLHHFLHQIHSAPWQHLALLSVGDWPFPRKGRLDPGER